jgi:hypothetical protein
MAKSVAAARTPVHHWVAGVLGDMVYMQLVVLAGCLFFAGCSRAMARKGVSK